jgi:CDP-diacylglycerol--glycerol-3-phosphate 3-phosphatidyltransferase
MLTFKNYNIADWFSFYRVIASPFLLLLVIMGAREAFSWMLLISYCTDMIDGFLARRLKITSPRGSQLDSLGDQVTLGVAFIGLGLPIGLAIGVAIGQSKEQEAEKNGKTY